MKKNKKTKRSKKTHCGGVWVCFGYNLRAIKEIDKIEALSARWSLIKELDLLTEKKLCENICK